MILEAVEKAEGIKSNIDQERRYATESAFFFTGGSGGFVQPSECGIEILKEELPFVPEDGAYYWKKQFEVEGSSCIEDEDCAVNGADSYCYGGSCYLPECRAIPSQEDFLATARNYLNTYFSKTDARVCNLINLEDSSVPKTNCLQYKADLVDYDWSDDVTIELNDWRSWQIEFNYFPDRPYLSVVRLAGGQVILDYDYSTLSNLRMISDALRMLRFAQDYVDGNYGLRDQSWINNELEQFIKTRYGTSIVGLLVCDNNVPRNCYPYFDWMSSFMSYFLIDDTDLPACSVNKDDGTGTFRYFNGQGKESGIEIGLFNCFGDDRRNVNPETGDAYNGQYTDNANAVTCAQFCYDTLTGYVKEEITTMLTDHTAYYSFPSKLKAKTGYNWRGYMFDVGVDVECKEVVFRDPMSGKDCFSKSCEGDLSEMSCISFAAYKDDDGLLDSINFDLTANNYRYFTSESSVIIRGDFEESVGTAYGVIVEKEDGTLVTSSISNDPKYIRFNTGTLAAGENLFTVTIIDISSGEVLIKSNIVVYKL